MFENSRAISGGIRKEIIDVVSFVAKRRFPGSQPISFDLQSLQLLETEECVYTLTTHLSSHSDN